MLDRVATFFAQVLLPWYSLHYLYLFSTAITVF